MAHAAPRRTRDASFQGRKEAAAKASLKFQKQCTFKPSINRPACRRRTRNAKGWRLHRGGAAAASLKSSSAPSNRRTTTCQRGVADGATRRIGRQTRRRGGLARHPSSSATRTNWPRSTGRAPTRRSTWPKPTSGATAGATQCAPSARASERGAFLPPTPTRASSTTPAAPAPHRVRARLDAQNAPARVGVGRRAPLNEGCARGPRRSEIPLALPPPPLPPKAPGFVLFSTFGWLFRGVRRRVVRVGGIKGGGVDGLGSRDASKPLLSRLAQRTGLR